MFAKFFNTIKAFFTNLFGGDKSNQKPPARPKPPVPEELIPQDGSEIKPDTLVIVASEMDHVVILPTDPEEEFDKDIFDEVKPQPQPEPTPVVPEPAKPEPPKTEAPKPATPQPAKPAAPKGRYLWCLDNGHGQRTPGKRSPIFDDGRTRFFEFEFNRDIVRRIMARLDKEGVQYFNVVPEVDIDDFLQGRVDRANNRQSALPKLFVSIHANAAPAANENTWAADSISGIETWFFHGSKRGQKLAGIFQKHLIEKTGFKNRHLKSRPEGQFFVLRRTTMTSVLTENGFYNNKKEAAELMKDSVRQQIADAHVEAILEIERNGL